MDKEEREHSLRGYAACPLPKKYLQGGQKCPPSFLNNYSPSSFRVRAGNDATTS